MTRFDVILSAFAGAVALLSVSSCVKVETDGETVPANAISYQVVNCNMKSPDVEAPSTKAGATVFDDKSTFISGAYHLPEGRTWDADKDGAIVYISPVEISKAGNVWKDKDNVYYWPESGSLTFFAYTPSSLAQASGTGNGVSITTSGVSYKGWEAAGDNLECDFMVAVPAKDKSSNSHEYYSDGVPMLFKHKLTQIQFVAFVEKDDPDNDVYIEKLTLTNIYRSGDYTQAGSDEGAWRNRTSPAEYVLFETESPVRLSTSETKLMPEGLETMLMLPQNLSALAAGDENIGEKRDTPEIVISYYQGTADKADRKEGRVKFTDIRSYLWAMGTSVKYSISFGDTGYPILFDPSVNTWADGEGIGLIVGGGTE